MRSQLGRVRHFHHYHVGGLLIISLFPRAWLLTLSSNSEIIAAGISIREFREWKQAGRPKTLIHGQHSHALVDEEYAVESIKDQRKEAPVQAAKQAYFQSEQRPSRQDHSRHEIPGQNQTAPREQRREQEERYMQTSENTRYPGQQQYESREGRY